ncbi:MAG: PepSY domain-containing protein [Planctomycetota bacterium]|nr:MAG: PepSY domain-containing protein [Planctomycetota bacterium]
MASTWSNRWIHYWLGSISALPVVVILVSGLLLQVKKQVPWVQPPEQKGAGKIPAITMGAILEACQSVPEAGVVSWGDISRVDIRPSRGMMKVLVKNNWEVQIDFQTGQVLQVAYRRSDLIESFHDGSWFGDWAKIGLFLPAGLILLVLWVTGLVLFVQPYRRKGQRGRDLAKG